MPDSRKKQCLQNSVLNQRALILIPYLLAPLFGGKFLPRAIALYGSWIVTAFILKYISSFAKSKIRMKKFKWYSISIWMVLSAFIWFPNYIGLLISVFILAGMLIGFNAQEKSEWHDEK